MSGRRAWQALLVAGAGVVGLGAAAACSPEATSQPPLDTDAAVLFLHHSTGGVIWGGGIPEQLAARNEAGGTAYTIAERAYPDAPYPWDNYPYDYWNLWVDSPGDSEQATLETLTAEADVIVFKHCFPVSDVEADTGAPDVASSRKSRENYELQYEALADELHAFPDTRFIVWTGAARRESETDAEHATRARDFFTWVKDEWDEVGDNIFVWDFRQLETGGGLYLLPENASGDSHPNATFASAVAPLFVDRLVEVIEGRGDQGSLTGE